MATMNGKLLKSVQWTLSSSDYPKNSVTTSREFSINVDGKLSKWFLNSGYIDLHSSGANLELQRHAAGNVILYYKVGVANPMEVTITVLDQVNGEMSMSKTFKTIAFNGHGSHQVGSFEIAPVSVKMPHHERFVKNGKMFVICEFRDIASSTDQKKMEQTVSNSFSETQIFKMMTMSEREMVLFKTTGGHEWKVYKKMVSDKSPVIKKMLESPKTDDSPCQVVDISRYSGKVVEELLRFILLGKIDMLDEVDIELYVAAKEYKIDDLPKICLESMKSRLSFKNVIEILQFVVTHDEVEKELYEACCQTIFRYIPIESFSAKLDLMSDKITGRVFKDLYKKLNLSDKASCEIEAL